MNRRQWPLAVVAVLVIAVALRLGSLFWSPLPYNPDGIHYAAWARDALAVGHLQLGELATDSVGFATLLATVAEVTGQPPLYVAQLASGVVGGVTVVFAIAFAHRIAPSGWPPARRRFVAILAGLLLAVDGLYVYRSMATDETTAGLLLVPLVALAVGRGLVAASRRWLLVATLAVLSIPPLHNHDGVLVALIITMAGVYALRKRVTIRRGLAVVAAVAGTWVWVVGYHRVAAALTPARVIQTGRLRDAPGLFLAWIVLIAVAVLWFLTTSRRLQRGAVAALVGSWFAVLALNAVRVVFPGTMATSRTLLVMLVPLSVPALLGTLGVHRLVRNRDDGSKLATLVLLAAPVTLIGFSLTAGLTPVNLATAFRTHLYVHLPVAAMAAVVFGAVFSRRDVLRSLPLRAIGVAALVLCAAISVPVAFTGLQHRPYKTITTPAEFEATEFAATHVGGPWATDDHLARVAGYHRRNLSVSGRAGWLRPGGRATKTPVFSWLQRNARPPVCPTLAQQSWSTTGAQFYPHSPVGIDRDALQRWAATNEVVYSVGSPDPLVLVRPAGVDRAGC